MTKIGKLEVPEDASASEKLRIAMAGLFPRTDPIGYSGLVPVLNTLKVSEPASSASIAMCIPGVGDPDLIFTLRVAKPGAYLEKAEEFMHPSLLNTDVYSVVRSYMLLDLVGLSDLAIVSMPVDRNRLEFGLNYWYQILLHSDSVHRIVLTIPLRNRVFSVQRNMERAHRAVSSLRKCMVSRLLLPTHPEPEELWGPLELWLFAYLQGLVLNAEHEVEWGTAGNYSVTVTISIEEGTFRSVVLLCGRVLEGVSDTFESKLRQIVW